MICGKCTLTYIANVVQTSEVLAVIKRVVGFKLGLHLDLWRLCCLG